MNNDPSSHINEQINRSFINQSGDLNEINFVDITVIIIKHIKLVLYAFIIFTLISTALLIFKKDKFQIITIFEVGLINLDTPIETSTSIKAKLVNGLIPKLLKDLGIEEEIFIDVQIAKDNSLIQLISAATTNKLSLHKDIHTNLINNIYNHHKNIIEKYKTNLTSQLNNIQNSIINSKNIDTMNPTEFIDAHIKLNSFVESKIVVLGQQGIKPPSLPKSTMLFILIIINIFISLSCAFIFEFILKVNDRIATK